MAAQQKYVRARPERDYSYETTLGIDWGSVGIRAKVYQHLGDGAIIDQLIHPTEKLECPGPPGLQRQFSPQIYPFDITDDNTSKAMVYLGNKHTPSRRSISAKLGMYAVVGVSDEIARQSAQLQELGDLVHQKPELKRMIRLGIEQIMCRVLEKAYQCLCPLTRRVRFDAIALTIPAQWTIELEEEYGERLMTAWEQTFYSTAPEIIFLTEGQTNLHYAFHGNTTPALNDRQALFQQDLQDFFNIGKHSNAVLLVDAGGHSTNCSLVTICQDNNQLEISPDRGVLGGTGLWAWHALQLAKAKWTSWCPYRPMPLEIENEFLRMFYLYSETFRHSAGHPLAIWASYDSGRELFDYELPTLEIIRTFEDANARTFALIEEGMLQLKDLQPSCEKIKIVIGGGSSMSLMWVEHMNSMCRKYQMEEPIYLWKIDPEYECSRLAAGANYALAKARSVAQFVDKAAFGLAVKKRFQGAHGWTEDWHYKANLLWAQGNKWATTIKTDGTEEFKVICQPDYDDPRPKSTIKPNYKAYDLLPIPCRKKGNLQFDFQIDTDTDKLKLKIKHRGISESGKTGRSSELGNVKFDLWVPPGSRCLQIWDCVEDIEGKMNTAFQEPQQSSDGDDPDGDEVDEMDVDPGEAEQHSASQNPQAADDDGDDMGIADDEDSASNWSSAAPLLQARAGEPQQAADDVDMGGFEAADEADSITAAAMLEEPTQSPEGGSQAARRRPRRGSRVPTGMFAL